MEVLFYANQVNSVTQKLRLIMNSEGYTDRLRSYSAIADLSLRLHKPKQDVALMVIAAADRDELLSLLLLRDQMKDIPLVLILPDQDKETIAIGHKLFPRFISYQQSDLSDVSGVVNRILNNRDCANKEAHFDETIQRHQDQE